jgi:DNA-binding NarL/FixJ family response regulator
VIRVLIADDQRLVRAGFRMILAGESDIEVVGEAGDGDEAITLASRLRPDVVLMDIRMPGLDGIEATRRIVAGEPGVRVVILTMFDVDEYVFEALRAGASAFLLKDAPEHQLLSAIRVVADGASLFAPSVTQRVIDQFTTRLGSTAEDRLSGLTERERDVLTLLAQGLSNKQIADELYLSEHTAKSHVAKILQKLQLTSRVQAVVVAYETGLVRPGASGGGR